jgi:hypothetical protein
MIGRVTISTNVPTNQEAWLRLFTLLALSTSLHL